MSESFEILCSHVRNMAAAGNYVKSTKNSVLHNDDSSIVPNESVNIITRYTNMNERITSVD